VGGLVAGTREYFPIAWHFVPSREKNSPLGEVNQSREGGTKNDL